MVVIKFAEFDECKHGYNDCHDMADCIDKRRGYICVCRPGYEGKGLQGVWANGRECYGEIILVQYKVVYAWYRQ